MWFSGEWRTLLADGSWTTEYDGGSTGVLTKVNLVSNDGVTSKPYDCGA